MRIYLIFALLIAAILFSSCSNMRSPNTSPKNTKSKTKTKQSSKKVDDNKVDDNNDSNETQFVRFKDTMKVVLAPVIANDRTNNNMNNELDTVIEEFENKEYDSACEKIQAYVETLSESDTLYIEAKYYESECHIIKGNSQAAIAILKYLLSNKDLTVLVRERCIVRLGQLHCLEGNTKEANRLFNILKKDYPNSIYTKLANCDAIKSQ